jgi:hypothetical protein
MNRVPAWIKMLVLTGIVWLSRDEVMELYPAKSDGGEDLRVTCP